MNMHMLHTSQDESVLRAALDVLADAIVITDRGGRILWANPALERLTGYAWSEVEGRTPALFCSGEQDAAFYQDLWQTILSGRVWRGELVNRRKDGSLYTERMAITPVQEADGTVARFVAVKTDISRERAEREALRRLNRCLRALGAVGAEVARELDLEAVLRLIVRRAVELVGADIGEIWVWEEEGQLLLPRASWGHTLRSCLPRRLGEGFSGVAAERRTAMLDNDYPNSPHAMPGVVAGGIVATLSHPLVCQDRLLGVIGLGKRSRERPFCQEDLEIAGLFADQAAIAIENARLYEAVRRHAEELEARVADRTGQLEAARRAAERASSYKSEFLANMSHELRTPLNSILGFAQLVEEQGEALPADRRLRYLHHIRTSGAHLLALVNGILDLSKIEAGKVELQPELISVGGVIEEVLLIIRGLAIKKQQIVECQVEDGLPQILADPVRLKQILFNLLSNAVKFTPEGGSVRVVACRRNEGAPPSIVPAGECLELQIRDTGVGLDPEEVPRLFQEFVRLARTRDAAPEGTGLGLAVTRKLVELHGGTIQVESRGIGHGCTFTVCLPIVGRTAGEA